MYWKSIYNDEDGWKENLNEEYGNQNFYSDQTWILPYISHGSTFNHHGSHGIETNPGLHSENFPSFHSFPVGLRRLTQTQYSPTRPIPRRVHFHKYSFPAGRRKVHLVRPRPILGRIFYRSRGRKVVRPFITGRSLDLRPGIDNEVPENKEEGIRFKYPMEGLDLRYILGLPPWFLKSSS